MSVADSRQVHFVMPEGVDDPARPSGGNVYDRRLCRELVALGWVVNEHHVPASELARALASVPDRGVVLVDGLIASEALLAETSRLRIVVLLHMPVGDDHERAVLSAAAAVVTTSDWAKGQVPGVHVSVAAPGSDLAPRAAGSRSGGNLPSTSTLASSTSFATVTRTACASVGLCPGSAWMRRMPRRTCSSPLRGGRPTE